MIINFSVDREDVVDTCINSGLFTCGDELEFAAVVSRAEILPKERRSIDRLPPYIEWLATQVLKFSDRECLKKVRGENDKELHASVEFLFLNECITLWND